MLLEQLCDRDVQLGHICKEAAVLTVAFSGEGTIVDLTGSLILAAL